MKIIVSNIQRFCLHDGPGIRTTVFLKGCNLRCPWCSNPENLSFDIQKYKNIYEEDYFGKEYTLKDLEKEILRDLKFYQNDGGVTFSGGEPLLYFKELEPLLKKLQNLKINICVETALNVDVSLTMIAIKYVNEFITDIKILDDRNSYKIKADPNLYEKNIKILEKSKVKILFRLPLVKEYTYTEKNIDCIISFLNKYNFNELQMFNIHNLGEKKYDSLKMNKFFAEKLSNLEINNLIKKFSENNIKATLIKI